MSDTPSFFEAIQAVIELSLDDVNVSIPAKVTEYDETTQKATVQPQIERAFVDAEGVRQHERRPSITNVPVAFQGGGGGRLTFPVAVGDVVTLIFSHASLDKWLSVGREVDPLDDRRHSISDAIAFPGLFDFKNAPAAHATATVLSGSEVKLGSLDADEGVIKGGERDTAEQTFLTALNTFAQATLAAAPAKATFATAVGVFKSAASGAVSTKVKAE